MERGGWKTKMDHPLISISELPKIRASDVPVSRPVELPSLDHVIEIPKVAGLHHLYTRKAA